MYTVILDSFVLGSLVPFLKGNAPKLFTNCLAS